MVNGIDPETFNLRKFAESLVREGNEGIKWERKKLEWILEERDKANSRDTETKAA